MLWTKQGTASPTEREIENTVKGIVDITDKLGHGAVEEWEVDELLEWTNGLNFDHYVTEWKEFGTSGRSDQIEGKWCNSRTGGGNVVLQCVKTPACFRLLVKPR